MVTECMEIDDTSQQMITKLDSKDSLQIQKELIKIKNLIIGNNNFKNQYLKYDIINKLLELIIKYENNYSLINEIVVIFASFAKGNDKHLRILLDDYNLNEKLFNLLISISNKHDLIDSDNINIEQNIDSCTKRLIESCLCCLKNLYSTYFNELTNTKCIYSVNSIKLLLKLFNISLKTKEYIIELLSNTCLTKENQVLLINSGAIPLFSCLLKHTTSNIQLITLKFYNSISFDSQESCKIMLNTIYNEHSLSDIISLYLSRDKSNEIQLYAAKCLTNMAHSGTLDYQSPLIRLKTLSTLVRLCQKTMPKKLLILSISTLAYLIELSTELQEIASYLEQIIPTLSCFILQTNLNKLISFNDLFTLKQTSTTKISCFILNANYEYTCLKLIDNNNQQQELDTRLCLVSFYALAALSSNSEDVRRRISNQEGLMNCIIECIRQNINKQLRLSALSLMHSLSRSVQQLRTKFLDHKVWTPIIDLIQINDEHLICLTTAILANLLLEFSPSKETMIDYGIINILVKLVDHTQMSIRINSIWALMNMSFQSEQKTKQLILQQLSMDKIFQLLTEYDENLIMKTLGLMRNLICTKSHIDHIMSNHGTKVIQSVIMILEGDYSILIKEQALCILANVADGNLSKEYIMGNEDLLRKLNNFMTSNTIQLQIASVFCISNLVWSSDEGACERQVKLKEMGFQRQLQKLLHSSDHILFDKVKTALQQFN